MEGSIPPQPPSRPGPPAPPRAPASPPPMPGAPPLPTPPAQPVAPTRPAAPVRPQATPSPTATTAPEGQRDFNSFNAQQDVDTRPCANCGGQLEFHIGDQNLACPHCGHSQAIEHAEGAAVVEQSWASLQMNQMSGRAMSHAEGEKEVVCQNCGGHTTFIGTMTSTRCPYCATPVQRTDIHEAPDRLNVDGVLPFGVTDKAASDIVDGWISKRWFAPTEFKKYSTAGSFESVYAAYFTYDAQATTDYTGERGNRHTRTVGHGDNKRTETYTVWHRANGRVHNSFDDITILANTGFTEKYVTRLDPWPSQNMQPYNRDFIAGHLCRTYDRDVEECYGQARQVMDNTIDSTIRRDIGGDEQRIHNRQTHLANVTYKHVLLPIWLLTVIYDGQPWQVFINGATGEIHGERPWSKVKILATVITVIVLIVLLVVLNNVLRS